MRRSHWAPHIGLCDRSCVALLVEKQEPSVEWLEVSVTADAEAAEAIAELLAPFAYHGVAIEAGPEGLAAGPVVVRAYLPLERAQTAVQRRIEEALWHLGQIRPIGRPTFRRIAEADWAEAWKEHYHVLHIGKRLVVRPSWREYVPAPGEIVVTLDPGQAFGSGVHPTTRMALLALEEFVQPGMDVLDLGTGSGILAIAAARLGARNVLALDNDPVAVEVAQANVVANDVGDVVSVQLGSLAEATGCYEVIAVNILAQVIVEMMQAGLALRVRPGGVIIATGILSYQEGNICRVAQSCGFGLEQRWQIEDWVCLALRQDKD